MSYIPAFPIRDRDGDPVFNGMDIRDWFAGQALASLSEKDRQNLTDKEIAYTCFLQAERMLEMSDKGPLTQKSQEVTQDANG